LNMKINKRQLKSVSWWDKICEKIKRVFNRMGMASN
jgi:hypothetical protein